MGTNVVQLSDNGSEGEKGKFVRSVTQIDEAAWNQTDQREVKNTLENVKDESCRRTSLRNS